MFSFTSIRTKLMVPTLLLTVLLLSVLGVFIAVNNYLGIQRMLVARADSTADYLAKVSVESYRNFNFADLDNLVMELKKEPEVDFAVFYDPAGMALTKQAVDSMASWYVVERTVADEHGARLGLLKLGYNRSAIVETLRFSIIILLCGILTAIVLLFFGMRELSERVIIRRVVEMEELAKRMADGDLQITASAVGNDEIALLGAALNTMAGRLGELLRRMQSRNVELEEWQRNDLWIKSGLNDLYVVLQREHTLAEFADKVLSQITEYVGARVGIFHLYDDVIQALRPIAGYALDDASRFNRTTAIGEGIVGQAARERKMIRLTSVPRGYLQIGSALGGTDPAAIIALPILNDEGLLGILELGSFKPFSDTEAVFLSQAMENVGMAMHTIRSRERIAELLEETRRQAERLGMRQEELQQRNEELTERTRLLSEQQRIRPS